MTAAPSLSRTLLWLAAAIFVVLQLSLWFGEGGVRDVHRLKGAVALQQAENLRLRQRNDVLEAEVNDLKTGHAAIEERARLDLGMIKDDETFYLVTGKALSGSATARMPATPAVVHAPKDSVSEAAAEPERQP
ncbi:cell division protein FtsB [Paraperlucidibaca sp.]|uniref:cell division protein FtsB n=1 Tax=Paraperlucidibaca sp. TaxID=2708021 RepID=UPI0030F379BE